MNETRAEIRRYAAAAVKFKRKWPSPTAILNQLETGSKSTVCDELKHWSNKVLGILSHSILEDGTVLEIPEWVTQELHKKDQRISELEDSLKLQTLAVEKLKHEVTQTYERFDGFQTKMLLELDRARQNANQPNEAMARELKKERSERILVESKAKLRINSLIQLCNNNGVEIPFNTSLD